jgi:hypothetical protein
MLSRGKYALFSEYTDLSQANGLLKNIFMLRS